MITHILPQLLRSSTRQDVFMATELTMTMSSDDKSLPELPVVLELDPSVSLGHHTVLFYLLQHRASP